MLKDHQDACGHSFEDYLRGRAVSQIVERSDGYVDPDGLKGYFDAIKDWHPVEKQAMRYVRGRVLDVGCGAGRHAIHLQGKGFDVVGIDNSPLAVNVCRERGLRNARGMSITEVSARLGMFDTIIMMGNNFGLFGNLTRARWLLRRMSRMTSTTGRIVAATTDIYDTDVPEHLMYQAQNRARGRMSGQIRFRIRYKKYATPWIDYLMVSREELEGILQGTDWTVSKYLDTDAAQYVAVIDKKKA